MTLPSHGRIIALWSPPRSRSTAFLRMMMARTDVLALHEPFSGVTDFGECDVGGIVAHSADDVIATLRRLSTSAVVFFKDTMDFRYPAVLADRRFLAETRHVFLIRRPDEVIASHFALNSRLGGDEIGFDHLRELYLAVASAQGTEPPVVDADDLVRHTAATVRTCCEHMGLPFDDDAMRWTPTSPAQFERTARWHTTANSTTTFVETATSYTDTVDNHPLLARYYHDQLPHYEYLYARRVRPASATKESP